MKNLGNLKPSKGANVRKKRLGRGIGSGLGKTAGKGHKGQKARKSSDVPAGFEGGQVPLYRRLPKRGFKNPFRVNYESVNLSSLEKLPAGSAVNAESLHKAGFVSRPDAKIKLLGKGKLSAALNVSVDKASASAKAAVEKAGGKLQLLYVKPEAPKKEKKKKKK